MTLAANRQTARNEKSLRLRHQFRDGRQTRSQERTLKLPALLVMGLLVLMLLYKAYVSNPGVSRFWAWLPAWAIYFVLGALSPELRPRWSRLSASIWLPWVGALVLIAAPLAVLIQGPSLGGLPAMPDWPSINSALLVTCLAYGAMGSAMSWRSSVSSPRRVPPPRSPRMVQVLALFALAYLGAGLKLAQLGGLGGYLSGEITTVHSGGSATPAGLLGAFLPALGPAAVVLSWRSLGQQSAVVRVVVALIGLLPLTVFGYNRGAWFFPASVLIVISLKLTPKLGRVTAVLGLVALPVILLGLGSFRTSAHWRSVGYESEAAVDPLGQFQIYLNAPQRMAFALQADPNTQTLLPSVLSPIPAIGEPFRDSSGPALFNLAIYGDDRSQDQILPLGAELYWIAGPASVIIGYICLGVLLGRVSVGSGPERDPVRLYFPLLAGLWLSLALIWSASVVVQLFVYFWIVPYSVFRLGRLY